MEVVGMPSKDHPAFKRVTPTTREPLPSNQPYFLCKQFAAIYIQMCKKLSRRGQGGRGKNLY